MVESIPEGKSLCNIPSQSLVVPESKAHALIQLEENPGVNQFLSLQGNTISMILVTQHCGWIFFSVSITFFVSSSEILRFRISEEEGKHIVKIASITSSLSCFPFQSWYHSSKNQIQNTTFLDMTKPGMWL